MARGAHTSPQRTLFGKRRKSQKKQQKLVQRNQEILRSLQK